MKSLSLPKAKGLSLPRAAVEVTAAPALEACGGTEACGGRLWATLRQTCVNLPLTHPEQRGSVSKGGLVGGAENAPVLLALGSWVIFSPLQCTHVAA